MGTLGPGQHIWFQYIIVPEHERWYEKGRLSVQEFAGRTKKKAGILGDLRTDLADIFSKLFSAFLGPIEFEPAAEQKKEESPLEFRLTPVEKDVLKALESNVGKNMFKVKMRFVYLARRENYDLASVSAFIGGIKQFADLNLNSFKPHDPSKTKADFILVNERLRFRQRRIFKRFKTRDMDGMKFYLSTEELATVYHLPDMSVVAPSVIKIEAKQGGAPANLPVA
jgi:hypothetical protein